MGDTESALSCSLPPSPLPSARRDCLFPKRLRAPTVSAAVAPAKVAARRCVRS